MSDLSKLLKERRSDRVPYDPNRPMAKEIIKQILEAGIWAPTAHNMQNFEIVVVDDKEVLEKIGNVKSSLSEVFVRENYAQLSSSEEELKRKKVGLLGTMFPPSWRDPTKFREIFRESSPSSLNQTIRDSPMLLFVLYDPRKRAPASEGDVLGFMSLGCVMENMWLMAHALGLSFQILSTFASPAVEKQVKRILNIPKPLKVAYACRLGYPTGSTKYLRVRRDLEDFTHHNIFGNKGI